MRYFLDNFKNVYNKDWPFGQFPAYEYYASTGTHVGTDFKVKVGTPVFAPVDGEMFKVDLNRYKGNVGIFIFTHKGIEWGLELCHLRELPKKGLFKEGDIIAYSGMTGEKVDGAHLHAVLHRDATVSKHYQELTSREQFLKLEKDGAIVDCFKWFCDEMEKAVEDVIKKEDITSLDVPIDTLPTNTPLVTRTETETKPTTASNQKTLLETILDFIRSFF